MFIVLQNFDSLETMLLGSCSNSLNFCKMFLIVNKEFEDILVTTKYSKFLINILEKLCNSCSWFVTTLYDNIFVFLLYMYN